MYDHGAGDALRGNTVGNVRRLDRVHSPELGNHRDIHVYLPPSYTDSGRHYPVVYMHDGQNLFDHAMSFAGEWGVDETMERIAHGGVEAIVVGVPNMGAARTRSTARIATPAWRRTGAMPTSVPDRYAQAARRRATSARAATPSTRAWSGRRWAG